MSAGPRTLQTSCASCTFFDDSQARAQGLCRHDPPHGGNGSTAWPVVKAEDWCGQFVFDGRPGAPESRLAA